MHQTCSNAGGDECYEGQGGQSPRQRGPSYHSSPPAVEHVGCIRTQWCFIPLGSVCNCLKNQRNENFTRFSNHGGSLLRQQPGTMTISHTQRENFTLFSDHGGSLPRRQPGTVTIGHSPTGKEALFRLMTLTKYDLNGTLPCPPSFPRQPRYLMDLSDLMVKAVPMKLMPSVRAIAWCWVTVISTDWSVLTYRCTTSHLSLL